jgi:hypothetical protein
MQSTAGHITAWHIAAEQDPLFSGKIREKKFHIDQK